MTVTPIGDALRWRAIKAVEEEYFSEVQAEINRRRGERVTSALVEYLRRFADEACCKHTERIGHQLGRFSFEIREDGEISISVMPVQPGTLTIWFH